MTAIAATTSTNSRKLCAGVASIDSESRHCVEVTLDAEPDERQFMDEADDAEGWELAALRAVGVTEFLDLDDEPAVRDTPAGTEPDWWIIRKTYKNGRERDDFYLYRTREAAEYDIEN